MIEYEIVEKLRLKQRAVSKKTVVLCWFLLCSSMATK